MIAVSGKKPPFPDPWEDDGWIWCYYEATSTESPTTLLYNSTAVSNMGANFIIDGVEVARTQTYTFSTIGEHLVKMKRNTNLPASTFRSVTALRRIYIPSVITTLTGSGSYGPFTSCSGLTHAHLPDTLTTIGRYSFSGCGQLDVINLDLPNLKTIEAAAFFNAGLRRASLKAPNLTTLGTESVFRNSKIKEVLDLGKVTSLPGSSYAMFQNCTNLRKVVLPSTLTSIGQRVFYGCSALVSINLDHPNLTTIGQAAFFSCPMTDVIVDLPSLTSLGSESFRYTGIGEIRSLGSLTAIPTSGSYGVFRPCKRLVKAILPSTLTSVGNYAFYECTSLSIVTIEATAPPTYGSYALPGTSVVQHIYVPAESVEDYKAASGWSSYASRIEAIPTT